MQDLRFRLKGFTVNADYMPKNESFCNLPVVAWEKLEERFPPGETLLLGPISYRSNNRFRRDRYLEGKARGYDFATWVHPSAQVEGASIGENSVIFDGCTVQPFAKIGTSSILWSKVHIGHHSAVGDNCFMASFCGIAGNSRVGDCTFFGGHTGLVDNCSIGSNCIVTAGAIVTQAVPDGSIVIGSKARILHNAADRFGRRILG